jgi:hypothetical protein
MTLPIDFLNIKFSFAEIFVGIYSPLPLDWIQNHRLSDAIEKSLTLLPKYTGVFYRDLLKKIQLEISDSSS